MVSVTAAVAALGLLKGVAAVGVLNGYWVCFTNCLLSLSLSKLLDNLLTINV